VTNPFPLDYDTWLTTEPRDDDPREDEEPDDFDERRQR
jgi:hypothetical protein